MGKPEPLELEVTYTIKGMWKATLSKFIVGLAEGVGILTIILLALIVGLIHIDVQWK